MFTYVHVVYTYLLTHEFLLSISRYSLIYTYVNVICVIALVNYMYELTGNEYKERSTKRGKSFC